VGETHCAFCVFVDPKRKDGAPLRIRERRVLKQFVEEYERARLDSDWTFLLRYDWWTCGGEPSHGGEAPCEKTTSHGVEWIGTVGSEHSRQSERGVRRADSQESGIPSPRLYPISGNARDRSLN
jgi:hypothetical protein